jgi:hypothetical protein
MHVNNPSSKIDRYLAASESLALDFIEYEARRIMRDHLHGYEFLMAMGVAYFNKSQHDAPDIYIKIGCTNEDCVSELFNFITEYDYCLGLTGNPMRFTADGPKVTDW